MKIKLARDRNNVWVYIPFLDKWLYMGEKSYAPFLNEKSVHVFDVEVNLPPQKFKIGNVLTFQEVIDNNLNEYVFFSKEYGGLLQYEDGEFLEFGIEVGSRNLPNYTFEVVWIPR